MTMQMTPLGDALAAENVECSPSALATQSSPAPAGGSASEAPASAVTQVVGIDLASMSDSLLVEDLAELQDEYRTTLAQIMETYVAPLKALYEPQIAQRKEEIERRIKAARATNAAVRAIPHRGYRVELEPVYGEAMKDLEAARAAQKLLPPDEARKLLKHVPEMIVPAYDEIGNPNSINALKRKYPADSEVGELLHRAYHKPQIGERLVIEKLPDAQNMAPLPKASPRGPEEGQNATEVEGQSGGIRAAARAPHPVLDVET